MSAAYYNQYLVNQVSGASPEELLLLLYNGVIRFLNEAEYAMSQGHVARQGELISKSIGIINELDATLNYEIGGQIAESLDALYTHMNRELLLANINDDASRVAQVKQLLIGLRDTWVQAIEQVHSGRNALKGKERQIPETADGLTQRGAAL